jgi:HD-GYP domain-containing protein (c-di-GMP phosphodiesterase class II)
MLSTIAVEDLRVGMYIQLEGGWLSHPFPRSAFRIASADQLTTLRGLGLKQVRWSPERSDLTAGAQVELPAPALARAGTGPADTAQAAEAGGEAARQAQARAEAQRAALRKQREAVLRCERRFGEVARGWREATEALATRPEQALQASQALAQCMLDELLVEQDLAIRVVNAPGGDRAAAHALNVSVMSLLIGRALQLSEQELLDLGQGALLHDIGKLELPDRLRYPDDQFTAAETAAYRDHVSRGLLLGRRMGLGTGALAVLGQHHEHADGSGFPLRLTAEKMTPAARIVAIVNRYDNLCNPAARVHPLTPHEAVSMLFAQGRNRFDATVLSAFIKMMGVYPAGSLVQLTDDRYAMVMSVNSTRPLKPRVLVYDARVPRSEALLLNLEQCPDLGIRRSLPAAKLPHAALEYLDPRPRVAYYFEALSAAPAGVAA